MTAIRHCAIWSVSWVCACAVTLATGAWSRTEAREAAAPPIDLSSGTLADALDELARERRVSIGTEGALPRIRVRPVRGAMTEGQALERLLAGTGYRARQTGPSAWRIERAPQSLAKPAAPILRPPAPPPSPLILVTATKQPTDILSLPASVSVVDAMHMPAGSGSLGGTGDIAARIDGLALTALGPGRNRMFLRGIADSAFGGESQSTVAVVLDETRLTYSAPDPDLRLVDIERVEVLKGPQGSLYGSGTLGGIYRMTPQPVDLEKTMAAISGGGSIVAGGAGGYSASAVANMPVIGGTAGLRLVAYTALEPGWIDSGTGVDRRRHINPTRVTGGRGQIGIVPAEGWRLDFTAMAQWLNSKDSRYTDRKGSYDRPAQLPEPHDNDLRHAAARLHGSLSGIDIMLSTGMTWHEVADMFDATVGAEGFGLPDPQILADDRRFRLWDTELRARGAWGAVAWLAGLSRIDASQSLSIRLLGGQDRALLLARNRRDSHETGAYLDLTYPVTGTLTAQVGGRFYHGFTADRVAASGGTLLREREQTGVTPSFALSWKPDPDRLVYLRYGSAVRQSAPGQSRSGGGDGVEGDELASLEIGWKQALGAGHVEASAWLSRWSHVRSDTLTPSALIETVEAGDARIAGVELSVDLPVGGGRSIEAGGNVTDARLIRNALGYALRDTRLPVVPDHSLRAALAQVFALGGMKGAARIGLRYVGPAHLSFDPDLDRRMGNLLESGVEASLSRGNWTLSAAAANPLGRKGRAFAYGNPLRYRMSPQIISQDPRTVSLTLAARF